MPKYSWLLFDADGTLFDFAKAEAFALRQTVEQSGYHYRDEYLTIFRQVNQQVWEAFEQGRMAHDVLKITRFNRFLDDVQLNGRAEKWSPIYLQYLAQGAYLLDGAEALVRDLAATYRLLIITNGICEVQRSRFGRSSIKPYIDEIIISGEIGVAKPAPEIFDTAFAAMGYPSKGGNLDHWRQPQFGYDRRVPIWDRHLLVQSRSPRTPGGYATHIRDSFTGHLARSPLVCTELNLPT